MMKPQKRRLSKEWIADESSGLTQERSDTKWERFVTCRFDRKDRRNKNGFNLSYFVRPGSTEPRRKAVLFCAGGPGQINKHGYDADETFATFLSFNQYDVVAFDLRGVGFSQFPPSTTFDKYLRTSLAVDDIEEIRRDWLGRDDRNRDVPWEAIIARSYGSLLAQQYARKHPRKVNKVVLLAPISRHMFEDPACTYQTFIEEVIRILRECLVNIYDSKDEAFLAEFGDLTNDQKATIVNTIFGNTQTENHGGVFETADIAFGNIQYLIDDYHRLKSSGVLERYGLARFDRSFYRALRDLRLVGKLFRKDNRDKGIQIGRILRDNILGKPFHEAANTEKHIQLHYRVLYNIWACDGLDPKFLQAFRVNGGNANNAAEAMGGMAHADGKINRWLKKVNINQRLMSKSWNPADYAHKVDTLILAGDADPVTCFNQAQHWYSKSLKGRRVLINLPGVGHNMALPEVEDESVLSGAIRVSALTVGPGEIRVAQGTAKGLSLNEKLHFKVSPGKLKERIKIVGEGVFLGKKVSRDNSVSDCILMLIKNVGNGELSMREIQDAPFPVECVFFSGVIRVVECETIPPNATRIAYGYIITASRNPKQVCKLQIDQDDADKLPTLLGFYIDGSSISLHFANNSVDKFQARTINCTLSRRTLKRTFRARIPDMEVGQAQDTIPVDLFEFRLEPEEMLDVQLTPEQAESLEAEIPHEAATDSIPIIIWVKDGAAESLSRRSMTLLIENPALSLEVKVDLDEDIPPGGAAKVFGNVQKLTWKNWLQIDKPVDLGSDVSMIGFNVLSKDKIKMFIENQGSATLRSFSGDWIYFDPRELNGATGGNVRSLHVGGSANSLEVRKPLLNRLIYSFLVRDIKEFSEEKQNKVLEQLHDGFGRNSVGFKTCYKED